MTDRLVSRPRALQSDGVTFADLKNDFVFRRIFAKHPDVLRDLLNDLLEREGDRRIEDVEYVALGQAPLVVGAKLSIVDVKCRDRSGTAFNVAIQVIHTRGFTNRVVYNACNANVAQLEQGQPRTSRVDLVALSICDFALWSDAERAAQGLPRVPMLSRWNMTERVPGRNDHFQVQYAFLELPKLPNRPPQTGAELWAWLFVHAPALGEVPKDLPPGPHRQAVELANEATFTQTELEAYQRVMDEIQQARELVNLAATAESRGEAKGKAQGRAEAKAEAVLAFLEARGVAVDTATRARILSCTDVPTLDQWIARAATVASADELFRAHS